MKYLNALQLPKVYYALHATAGVAHYPEMEGRPTVLFDENVLRRMDPTAQGKPLFVRHNAVVLESLEKDLAGVVVRSFFNEFDGGHWIEFTVQSDAGHEAIRRGWKISNCSVDKQVAPGGLWHGVKYQNQVMEAEYEHFALTDSPRYAESIVLTPEEFEEYNSEKQKQLARYKNSAGEDALKNPFEFFLPKNEKVELNPEAQVTLPISKKTGTVGHFLNEMDVQLSKAPEAGYADPSHKVKLHDNTETTVGELLERHKQLNEAHTALTTKYNDLVKEIDPEGKGEEGGEGHETPVHEKKENEETPEQKAEREKKEKEAAASKEADERRTNEIREKAKALRRANQQPIIADETRNLTTAEKKEKGKQLFGTEVPSKK